MSVYYLVSMAIKPFFDAAESPFFDKHGQPIKEGIYEFLRSDGRKVLYTLEFMEPSEEGKAPRLKVVHASGLAYFPQPAHALKTLDGEWVRWLGMPGRNEDDAADHRQA